MKRTVKKENSDKVKEPQKVDGTGCFESLNNN